MRFKTSLKSSTSLIDLTPLVDVIFLMLIFFIVTSDILPLKSLQIENAVLDRDATPLTTQLLVVMDAQNVIHVGSKKTIVDLMGVPEALRQEIAVLHAQHPDVEPTVVLSLDRRVEYGAFLRLFAYCQECTSRLRLVFQPTEEQSSDYL